MTYTCSLSTFMRCDVEWSYYRRFDTEQNLLLPPLYSQFYFKFSFQTSPSPHFTLRYYFSVGFKAFFHLYEKMIDLIFFATFAICPPWVWSDSQLQRIV